MTEYTIFEEINNGKINYREKEIEKIHQTSE